MNAGTAVMAILLNGEIGHAVKSSGKRAYDVADDFGREDVTEEMILDHLETLTDRFSSKKAAANEAILECIEYAEDAGLYNGVADMVPNTDLEVNCDEPHGTHLAEDSYLESVWEKAYEERRDRYKRTASASASMTDADLAMVESQPRPQSLSDGNAFRNTFTTSDITSEIRQDIEGYKPEKNVDIEAHIAKWTMNAEQARAFRIIAEHSLRNQPDQLRMFLAGPHGRTSRAPSPLS
jgi:hypothetical protein